MEEVDVEQFIKNIGKQIRNLRKDRNMTQLDLGIESGMDESAVQRIETGRTSPTIKTLYKIMIGLEIKFTELFEFPPEEEKKEE
ncbi:hypothetical protein IMCC3317_13700 [Kordia antarctica]|uniref:HTH cro/C1-type domain-containing protein n=1 Tax=Kordia antarctica TaxID=1218801 RepID=A0A7L4ZHR9_9FLAO|nr:helix-turn-helix transcriptional regulator [Kordia antarctica]QHI36017.1 hypothetical protein IMCC3317_13700 [Kordia antarctica]